MRLNRSSFSFGVIPQLKMVEQPKLSTSWTIMVCIDTSCIHKYVAHVCMLNIYIYIIIYTVFIQKLMISFSNIRDPSTTVCCPPSPKTATSWVPALRSWHGWKPQGCSKNLEPNPDVYCQIKHQIAQSCCFRDSACTTGACTQSAMATMATRRHAGSGDPKMARS